MKTQAEKSWEKKGEGEIKMREKQRKMQKLAYRDKRNVLCTNTNKMMKLKILKFYWYYCTSSTDYREREKEREER